MDDVLPFGSAIAVICLAGLLAVAANRVSGVLRIPTPAIFLISAAIASDVVPQLYDIPVQTVQRVVTVMLVLLLFDGGMHIGWSRFREAAGAVLWIGVAGTLLTTLGIAALAHVLFGFDWRASLLLGVAISPTDPAVVFSVLGRRQISGRSGTVLEGESGANDPVGIAAMAALLATGGAGGLDAMGDGTLEFAREMVIGGLVGVLGGYAMTWALRRMPLPDGALYPLRTLLGAGAIYGLATVAHGSGFLAVFVAGILLGDVRAPYRGEIERFHSSLASLAEIVAFTVLGLTVHLDELFSRTGLIGLSLAALLAFVVRPVLVGVLLLPIRLRAGERLFIMWAGLKGAVPILLGTYILTSGVPRAGDLYEIVIVVVAFSVVLQGGLVPLVAGWARVPMSERPTEPYTLGMRFQEEPTGLRRYVVAPGSPADGTSLAELDLGESGWISMINRDGAITPVHGSTVLQAGDQVLLLADPLGTDHPDDLFKTVEPDTGPLASSE